MVCACLYLAYLVYYELYIRVIIYDIISLDPFILFSMPHDVVIVTVTCVIGLVTVVTLYHSS